MVVVVALLGVFVMGTPYPAVADVAYDGTADKQVVYTDIPPEQGGG